MNSNEALDFLINSPLYGRRTSQMLLAPLSVYDVQKLSFDKAVEQFVVFAYEDICKDIFVNLCKKGAISFVLSRVGSYWLNDYDGETEIDVMAVDHQNKRIFAGECKYHAKHVDAPVYFALKEKVENTREIKKVFPGYDVVYGVFSKSGFTQRMRDTARENPGLYLINEDDFIASEKEKNETEKYTDCSK